MSSEEGDSCQVRLKEPRLFQGYLTFSKQLTSFMFLVRTLSGNHPQSTDSGTSRSPMVPWLAHLREEAAERQCPHQLPTARCQAVGGQFQDLTCLSAPSSPDVAPGLSFQPHTRGERLQAPRPGIPAFSVISPFQSFPFLCLMRPEASIIPRGPLSSAGSMCWLYKHSPPGRSHHLKFQERAMLNRSEWTVESGSPSHKGSTLAGTLHGD